MPSTARDRSSRGRCPTTTTRSGRRQPASNDALRCYARTFTRFRAPAGAQLAEERVDLGAAMGVCVLTEDARQRPLPDLLSATGRQLVEQFGDVLAVARDQNLLARV